MAENPFESLIYKAGGRLVDCALALGVDKGSLTTYRRGEPAKVSSRLMAALGALGVDVPGFVSEYEAYRVERVRKVQADIRSNLTAGGDE